MNDLAKRLSDRLTLLESYPDVTREILLSCRSESTRKAYETDWKRFCLWADKHGLDQWPISPQTLGLYLVFLHSEGYAKSTIKRTVTVMHLAHDERDDPTGNREIRAILSGIMRRDRRPLKKARPITLGDLIALCQGLTALSYKRDLRDRALISLGWVGALRAGELVALNWSDLSEVNEGLEIKIRESKTNKTGEAEIVAIPYLRHEYSIICPVRNLSALVDVDSDAFLKSELPVFTGDAYPTGRRMSERTIERALERACKAANLNKRFTSHSLRRGFASFAASRGISSYALMAHGRWKSSAVAEGYIERAKLWTDNPIGELLGPSKVIQTKG